MVQLQKSETREKSEVKLRRSDIYKARTRDIHESTERARLT
jgi:hypothetical protein